MTEESERKAFEAAWDSLDWAEVYLATNESGNELDADKVAAWLMWQARAKGIAAPPREPTQSMMETAVGWPVSVAHPHLSLGPELAKALWQAMYDAAPTAAATPEPVAWRCFHCDESFADFAAAQTHFGRFEHSQPICQVDAAEYRRMEKALSVWQSEDTDLHREIGRLNARLSVVAREEEENGYAKGLADGRAAPAQAGPVEKKE